MQFTNFHFLLVQYSIPQSSAFSQAAIWYTYTFSVFLMPQTCFFSMSAKHVDKVFLHPHTHRRILRYSLVHTYTHTNNHSNFENPVSKLVFYHALFLSFEVPVQWMSNLKHFFKIPLKQRNQKKNQLPLSLYKCDSLNR